LFGVTCWGSADAVSCGLKPDVTWSEGLLRCLELTSARVDGAMTPLPIGVQLDAARARLLVCALGGVHGQADHPRPGVDACAGRLDLQRGALLLAWFVARHWVGPVRVATPQAKTA
jgi:hypothetical protein